MFHTQQDYFNLAYFPNPIGQGYLDLVLLYKIINGYIYLMTVLDRQWQVLK